MKNLESIIKTEFKTIGRHRYNSLKEALRILDQTNVDDMVRFREFHKISVSKAEKEVEKFEKKHNFNPTEKAIKYFEKLNSSKKVKKESNYTNEDFKKEMWQKFQKEYFNQNGVYYNTEEIYLNNLKPIFYYFLGDYENFIKCENVLKNNGCIPSLNKGLLIIGDFGNGKTSTLKAFSEVTKGTKKHFKVIGSKEAVTQYSFLKNDNYKQKEFYNDLINRNYLIDDILKESFASSYGKVNLIEQIIEEKERKKKMLHATLNYAEINGKKTEDLLISINQIGEKYGGYVYDRAYSMFNIIEFKGRSLRG